MSRDASEQDRLLQAAIQGDLKAQLVLARQFREAGRAADASVWLNKALQTGNPLAPVAVAAELLEARDAPSKFPSIISLLQKAASQNVGAAHRLLASLSPLITPEVGGFSRGMEHLRTASELGDPVATRQLGILLAGKTPESAEAEQCLWSAAKDGDNLAKFALMRRWCSDPSRGSVQHFDEWKREKWAQWHPLIGELKVDGIGNIKPNEPFSTPTLPASLDRPLPERVVISQAPAVWTIPKLFTQEECDYLVGLALPRLTQALIVNPQTGGPMRDPVRSSTNAFLRLHQQDLIVHQFNKRLAAAAGMPEENGEPTTVLHYTRGEQYLPHFDYLSEKMKGPMGYDIMGQRVATLLITLSASFVGGETLFLDSGYKWKGAVGDALLFWNVHKDGTPDPLTRHAGTPVTEGEKWIISKWYRERPVIT